MAANLILFMLVRLRCSFQYPFNDGVSIHSLGFAFEVEKHTVAERSVGYGPNIFAGDMASSSADCVFGVARFTSSAKTMFENIGPG